MKIRPVGAELFQPGRQKDRTDMTKLVVVFRKFAKAPKNPVGAQLFKSAHFLRFFCVTIGGALQTSALTH